jgi:hypothetical protein
MIGDINKIPQLIGYTSGLFEDLITSRSKLSLFGELAKNSASSFAVFNTKEGSTLFAEANLGVWFKEANIDYKIKVDLTKIRYEYRQYKYTISFGKEINGGKDLYLGNYKFENTRIGQNTFSSGQIAKSVVGNFNSLPKTELKNEVKFFKIVQIDGDYYLIYLASKPLKLWVFDRTTQVCLAGNNDVRKQDSNNLENMRSEVASFEQRKDTMSLFSVKTDDLSGLSWNDFHFYVLYMSEK